MHRRCFALLLLAGVIANCAACEPPASRTAQLTQENAELRHQIGLLKTDVVELRTINTRLQEQIAAGEHFGDRDLSKLVTVERVQIGRLSGCRDSDDVPGEDGVRIYLQLFDGDGHRIKAAGQIDVFVYNLTDEGAPDLITSCHYDVDQARQLWYGRAMTYHYRLDCLWQAPPQTHRIRVQVNFVEYLTGRIFRDSAEWSLTPDEPATSAR